MQLPVSYTDKMKELLGDQYEAYLASFEDQRLFGLRVNTNKISVKDFLAISPFHLTPVPWVDNGFYYEEEDRPAKHPYYFAGLYYLQEPSAMAPAYTLPLEQGDYVLDLCAAPGGKSTELGARLAGSGFLLSNDISASRAKALLKNLELFGISNVFVTCEDPKQLSERFPEYFHKILVDAPCSGEGMFRKDNRLIKSWEEQGPDYFAPIQQEILEEAAKMLRPGGLLLYSTCTFAKVEDEENIRKFLAAHPEFQLIPVYQEGLHQEQRLLNHRPEGFSSGYDMEEAVRLFPHQVKGEGHFLVLLQKNGTAIPQKGIPPKDSVKIPKEVEDFFKEVTLDLDFRFFEIIGEQVYLMPKANPNKKGLRTLRTGLHLGEYKKNRFEPSQALAMVLKANEYGTCVNLPLEDVNVIKYLKGETIEVEAHQLTGKGKTVLLVVDGFPLGWGKRNDLTIKNKYLPGWRWM